MRIEIAMNRTSLASKSLELSAVGIEARRTCFAKAKEFGLEFQRIKKKLEDTIVASSSGLENTSSS